jgi:hypothetical protein
MVARGWCPSDTQRRAGSLVVGLLLVFNPVYLGLMGIGGPTYRYERVPVERAKPPVWRAVRTGATHTHTEYEDRFVRTEDGYYLFTLDGSSSGGPGRWVLYGVGIVIGLGALRRAERLRS